MDINDVKHYPFYIYPDTKKKGGGFLIEYPDLPGCISKGDTIEEVISNGFVAALIWEDTALNNKEKIPKPWMFESGKWVQRVPKSLHARLILRAKEEGVSLNTLVISMISEGLGRRERYKPV